MRDEYIRFIEKVQITGTCWNWIGTTYRGGYGHFRRKINGVWKMYKAHRYSYEFHKGDIPNEHVIRHTCDHPGCVNPEHLLTGTAKQNTQDIIQRKGPMLIRNPLFQNLTLEIARAVRSFAESIPAIKQTETASFFSISKQQVSRILRKNIWKEEN